MTDWKWGPVTIGGELCSKSNSRQVVKMGDRTAVIKSQGARDYVKAFHAYCPKPPVPYEGNVCLTVHAYYKDRRRDLDVALLQDCLQEYRKKGILIMKGIIVNDRQVVEIHAYRAIDKQAPRVVFTLEAVL